MKAEADTGLVCFCLIARHFRIAADPEELARRYLPSSLSALPEDIVRIARRIGLKSRIVETSWERLDRTPLPAVFENIDGSFFVASRFIDDKLVVHRRGERKPRALGREELEQSWTGRIILITRRATLSALPDVFDLRWFISALHRYRRIIAEVLIGSFFLQILGLAAPLFFQVVVDKVLVHRSFSTLDVLAIGFAIVSTFEVILGGLRTYVFSQTTNRIDVELGARLFDHLLALPLAYFATRRVGDSVARMRELENIRNFITGSALTLSMDLLFTFVFFAVMFMYSTTLSLIVLASLPLYILVSVFVTPIFRKRLNERFSRGADN